MVILLGLIIGILLSAFFSGSETGFYRATRTRIALDALDGDRVARGLLWLTNNPSMFVATTLVGNNLANYLASAAIVLGTAKIFGPQSDAVDLGVSILMAPLIFIYGELLPKHFFFQAPNLLLRLAGPLFLFFTVLFLPLAAILWVLGWLLEQIIGESPTRSQLRLIRRELKRVLSEGHEAGVLLPTQKQMAEGMFTVATMSLDLFCLPPARLAVVRETMKPQEMLRIARRRRSAVLFVQDHRRHYRGYLHVVDLHLADEASPPHPRPLLELPRRTSSIEALNKLHTLDEPYAAVMGESGQMIGIIDARELGERILLTGTENQ